jgi:serine/threonine protein kinase/Leucine-rich repeat (LRR) protein
VAQLLQFDEVCEEFEAACRQGLQPLVEDFLARVPGPERARLESELSAIAAAYVQQAQPRSVEDCIGSLAQSGLMTADEARARIKALAPNQRPNDGHSLVRQLRAQGALTRFQADVILRGDDRRLVLGNYVLLAKLGGGGMGDVYQASHRRMDRIVALKFLRPAIAKSPDAVKRFQREVKAAARLSHPNIVTAHDADEAAGTHFLVMEYVDGSDLANLVKAQGPLPVAAAVRHVVQAATGLQYAHGQGVVHRDIKPANLLLSSAGQVKILDMGLARVDEAVGAADDGLTHSGQVMGTLDYVAPEQALDTHLADARSDIYSLGCTLHYLLTARPPFPADTVTKKILAHREQPVPSLRAERPDVPEWLDEVFQRMLAKTPEARFATMAEVIAALGQAPLPKTAAPASRTTGPGSQSETLSLQQARVETSSQEIASPVSPLSRDGRGAGGEGGAAVAKERLAARVRQAWRGLALPKKLAIAAALGLGFTLIVLGIVLKVPTREGTLLVEIDDPNAVVTVDGEEVQIQRRGEKGVLRLRVDPGKHRVRAEKDGIEVFAKEFTFGAREEIKCKIIAPEPPVPPSTPETQTADADRRVAEWVLGIGGTVCADGAEIGWERITQLPKSQFKLTSIGFAPGSQLEESQVERLKALRGVKKVLAASTSLADRDMPTVGALKTLEFLELSKTRVSDSGLMHLRGLTQLRELWLTDTAVTDKGMEHLGKLVSVEALMLAGTKLDGSGLRYLANLKKLQNLNISGTLVGDTALTHLSAMSHLQELDLEATRISDAGLRNLASLTSLEWLYVARTAVGDRGLESLGKMSRLKKLGLRWTKVTDRSAGVIASFEDLRSLFLEHTAFTDAGFEQLKPLSRLECLALHSLPVTDRALESIEHLSRLQSLYLFDTKVTAAGVAKLKVALPNCQLMVNPEIQAELDKMKAQSPVAYWPLDSVAGGRVKDETGTAEDGQIVGQVTSVAGIVGNALYFEDKEGPLSKTNTMRVDIPDHPRFHFRNALTVAAWVKPAGDVGGWILSKWYTPDSYLLSWSGGQYSFSVNVQFGERPGELVTATCPAKQDVWSHVAAVYDGAELRLYVDGQVRTCRKVAGPTEPGTSALAEHHIQDSTIPIRLGNGFHGALDEVRLFDVALTPEQVATLARRASASTADADRRAGEWALKAGGNVTILVSGAERVISGPTALPNAKIELIAVNLHGDTTVRQINGNDLANLKAATNLRAISLRSQPAITDDGLQHVAQLPNLATVELIDCPRITDAGIECLTGLPKLAGLDLTGTAVTDAALPKLARLSALQTLVLGGSKITGAGLQNLHLVRGLRMLRLRSNQGIGRDGYRHLESLKNLEELYLANTDLADADLQRIAGLKQLRVLDIGGTRVTDAALAQVAALARLTWLELAGTAITDEGMKHLRGMNLTFLGLNGTQVSDAGLAHLDKMTSLARLALGSTRVTNTGLSHLKSLGALEGLQVSGTSVGDSGLNIIKQFQAIGTLNLQGTAVTASGVAAFLAAKPKCNVLLSPETQAELDKTQKK